MPKTCHICDVEKPDEAFRLQPSKRTRRGECRTCERSQQREYRELVLTPEQLRARYQSVLAWRQKNIEFYREYQREYQRVYRKRKAAQKVQAGTTGDTAENG